MLEQTRAKPLSPTNVDKKKQVPYEGGTVHFISFKKEDLFGMFVFVCLFIFSTEIYCCRFIIIYPGALSRSINLFVELLLNQPDHLKFFSVTLKLCCVVILQVL